MVELRQMESDHKVPYFCTRWKGVKSLTCGIGQAYSTLSISTTNVNCERNSRRNIKINVSRTLVHNINVLSIFILLCFLLLSGFITTTKAEKKEHICGGRLIDALRYICGRRGIYNPTRHRGSSHSYSGNQVSITRLCCEVGCGFKQLERFCAPKSSKPPTRSRTRRPSGRSGPPSPPRYGPPSPPHVRRKRPPKPPTTTSLPTTTTIARITSTAATTRVARERSTLTELEKRYQTLVQKERRVHSKNSNRSARRKSFLHEIVKVAARISILKNEDDSEYTDYTEDSVFIEVTLRDESLSPTKH